MSNSAANNPNPWATYDSYKDCSQGICSIYCPQWCYIIFPPPPPFRLEDESGTVFSPLIIAVIGILASAFILVSYYAIFSKCCRRRRNHETGLEFSENRDQMNNEARQVAANVGLDETLIKSITVCKYKKGSGLVEGTDCSVCLSEFQEDDSLRLLPKCNHAFHLPCIDTWLKSHSSCPLCRASVVSSPAPPVQTPADPIRENSPEINVSVQQYQHRNDAVLVIQDIENAVGEESTVSIVVDEDVPKTSDAQDLENLGERYDMIEVGSQPLPIRRSLSLNSPLCQGPVLAVDIRRTSEEDDDGFRSESREKNNRSRMLNLVRSSPLALKRSVSTGRFMMFTRYGSNSSKPGNFIVPN